MSISWSSKIHVSLLFLHNMAAVVFSSDYFVLDTDEILSSAPFYQHDIVFLQVVSLSRYESNDFFAIAEPHFGAFTVGRVWLLWLPYQRSDNDSLHLRSVIHWVSFLGIVFPFFPEGSPLVELVDCYCTDLLQYWQMR